ncbi:MAG: Lrp/AsnC family transcriptional regulator [Nitrososphaerota archaeon]|nr:Lrp/AsnC family transcriptional regulator [Candidatus Calditenuaceae archaeon]MDW8072837.1 Lrp/AsnC family transcriptional regulator [Nitrososphaerota archaeon]
MSKKIDEVDLKLLNILSQNGRASYRELAKSLGVSVATVAYRVSRLQREGLIKGFTALIDYEKFGYDITAVIGLVIREGRLLEVQRELAQEPNVVAVYDVTGEVDSIIVARFRDRQELSQFVKKVLRMPYVERTSTHVVLEVVKEDFFSPQLIQGS